MEYEIVEHFSHKSYRLSARKTSAFRCRRLGRLSDRWSALESQIRVRRRIPRFVPLPSVSTALSSRRELRQRRHRLRSANEDGLRSGREFSSGESTHIHSLEQSIHSRISRKFGRIVQLAAANDAYEAAIERDAYDQACA